MVNIGLIVSIASLVGLVLIIKILNRFGVIRKRLPGLIVKKRLQVINGVVKNTKDYCVEGRNGKCFATKPLAKQYAESIARRI